MILFLSMAWAWAKKYWELLLGFLVLLLGVALGVNVQRRRAPVQQANPVKEAADKEAQAETRKAEYKAAEQKSEAVKEHDADLAVMVEKTQEATAAVEGSTEKTNAYLQNVSKNVRGEEP